MTGLCSLPVQGRDMPLIATSCPCDQGVTAPATHLAFGDFMYRVIDAEGRQIALIRKVAASSERYD